MPLGRTSTIFWSRLFALPVKVRVPVGLTSCPVAGSAVMPIVTSAAAITAIAVLRAMTVLLWAGVVYRRAGVNPFTARNRMGREADGLFYADRPGSGTPAREWSLTR